MIESKLGRPFYKYNQAVHDKIIAAIKRNAPYEIAAWSARISEQTLYDWLNLGKQHIKEGKSSEYAQLLEDIFNTEAEKVMSHLDAMERGERGWQARLAILERRWHRFFGQYAIEFKELFDNFQKLREDVKRYTDSPTEGATNAVKIRKKMDTKSHQAQE